MLSVTCDAFIHTLDECVKLATGDSSHSLLLLSPSPPKTTDGTTTASSRKSFTDFDATKSVFFRLLTYIPNRITVLFFRSASKTTFLPKDIVYKTFFNQLPLT